MDIWMIASAGLGVTTALSMAAWWCADRAASSAFRRERSYLRDMNRRSMMYSTACDEVNRISRLLDEKDELIRTLEAEAAAYSEIIVRNTPVRGEGGRFVRKVQ